MTKLPKKREILKSIPITSFEKEKQPTRAYRLGFANNTTYDLVELFPGIIYPPHWHKKARGSIIFVKGTGKLTIDNKKVSYKRGDSFYFGKRVKHGFEPKTHTLFLSMQTPPVKNPKTGKEDLEF